MFLEYSEGNFKTEVSDMNALKKMIIKRMVKKQVKTAKKTVLRKLSGKKFQSPKL